jgi:hypothetical protein
MRSDRLKQVMQDIDPGFDEKNLGMSKFSRFVHEAHQKGLLSMTKLENGQLEIGLPHGGAEHPVAAMPELESIDVDNAVASPNGVVQPREAGEAADEREERNRRGRRGRGRGRGRDREDRVRAPVPPAASTDLPARLTLAEEPSAPAAEAIGASGERLTRNEAFDIVRRAVETLTTDDDDTTRASDVRLRAREILSRDSESLNERMFIRILKDAHDSGIIDLRRRGDDFEVARAVEALPVAEQVARADAAAAPRPTLGVVPPRIGMGPRGAGRGRGRLDGPPPELLALGVVEEPAAAASSATVSVPEPQPATAAAVSDGPTDTGTQSSTEPAEEATRSAPRKRGRRTPASVARQAPPGTEAAATPAPSGARKSRARTAAKTAHRRARAKKGTPKNES